MEGEKLIDVCPVCQSRMLIQEHEDKWIGFLLEATSIIRNRIGSYCENCGARNRYNCKSAEQVNNELKNFVASIKVAEQSPRKG